MYQNVVVSIKLILAKNIGKHLLQNVLKHNFYY